MESVLKILEMRKFVQRVPASDGADESWRLDHDYLSGAVIEVERRFDRWNTFLRDAHQAWREARGDWLKRWKTLLTPWQQLALLWRRLRGQCRYGASRTFAALSTVRMLPYPAVVAIGATLYARELDRLDEARAQSLF